VSIVSAHIEIAAGAEPERESAAAYRIVQVRPPGSVHAEALTELAETVYCGMMRLGIAAFFREAAPVGARRIVLGAHLLDEHELLQMPDDAILYNSEQISAESPWLSKHYLNALRKHTVWDYSERNVEALRTLGVGSACYVPVGYTPELSRVGPAIEDIDVLFYGSINPRRQAVLEALQREGVKVVVLFGKYGEERDRLIARAKIVLSIHFYESRVFEIVRAAYLFTNFKAIVAECDSDTAIEPELRAAIRGVPYDGLVRACIDLLRDDGARRELADRAFAVFAARPEEEILGQALGLPMASSARSADVAAAPVLPRTLHIGSGKDFMPDALNVDVNAMWAPDIVADIADPAVVGLEIDTARFGRVRLCPDYFDRVVAYDVLEHIPQVVAAMTHCLQLLRPGGRFEIGVPYDLSLGAWQDPTHVRAFNENSWRYYTEWHWYLGWTRMRFDLVALAFQPSAWGTELLQTGKSREEALRTPRAIDYMRVVLRKRYLSDSEQRAALEYRRGRPGHGERRLDAPHV
jgi:hypothetical protein